MPDTGTIAERETRNAESETPAETLAVEIHVYRWKMWTRAIPVDGKLLHINSRIRVPLRIDECYVPVRVVFPTGFERQAAAAAEWIREAGYGDVVQFPKKEDSPS